MGASDSDLLRVQGISAGYGQMEILHGVSLEVRRSEMVSIIGPNGAGKSTVFKTIVGLLRAKTGRVVFDGHEISGLHADEMIRPDRGVAAAHKSLEAPGGRQDHAAVSLRLAIRHERHGHQRPRLQMRLGKRREGKVRHRIAVDQKEGVGANHRQRTPRAAGTAKHFRLLPGIPDADAEIAAVADTRRERLREMVKVQDQIGDVLTSEPPDDSSDDRLTGDGHSRLGTHVRQRLEPRAEAPCQDERMRDHPDALLGVEKHVRVCHSVLLAVTQEQAAIGVEQVV